MKKLFIIMLLILPLFACGSGTIDSTDDLSMISFLRYKKENSNITIVGLEGNYPKDIVIPKVINGHLVTRIESEAFANTTIETMSFPTSLTHVGIKLFDNCTNLKKLTIPSNISLDDIFKSYKDNNLKEIAFTEGSTRLYKGFYDSMTFIEKLTIPNSIVEIDDDSTKGFKGVIDLVIPGHISYNKHFLLSELQPKNVYISEGSLYIESYSFNTSYIESVYIPKSVTTIKRFAFADARKLNKVTFAEGSKLNSIQRGAFYSTAFTEISLPETVDHIGEEAFKKSALKTLVLPNKVTSISKNLFADSLIESITFGKNVKEINASVFYDCMALETVNILNKSVSIKSPLFKNCKKLKEINCDFAENDLIMEGFIGYESLVNWK